MFATPPLPFPFSFQYKSQKIVFISQLSPTRISTTFVESPGMQFDCHLQLLCIFPKKTKMQKLSSNPHLSPDYPPGYHAPLLQTFGGESSGGIISFGKLIFAEKQNKTIQNVKVSLLYLQFYWQSRLTPFPECLYVRELFYRLCQ